ncbi:tetratricopeptide (TPR) repeat protein [Chitinophaga sp. W2I13]|uniref:tetratricopeptide repeat protein n=1 Tax=Chitinophaga sp. W2I13 TaxID=3373923 RepID=UPI003D1FFF35
MLPDQDEKFKLVTTIARELSVQNKIYYIDSRLLLLAILELTHFPLPLEETDIQLLVTRLKSNGWEPIKGAGMVKDSIPLTLEAEEMVNSAAVLQVKLKHSHLSPEHLLLAMLSIQGVCRKQMESVGLIFEDYLEYIDKKWQSDIQMDISSVAMMPRSKPFRSRWFNWLSGFPISEKKKIASWLRMAVYFSKVNHYELLREYCNYVLEIDPDNVDANSLLGYALMKELRYENAQPYLEQAVKQEPEDAANKQNLASCLDANGHHVRALEILEEILAEQPDNVPVLNNIGFFLANAGNYDEAIRYLDKAISLNPDFAYSYNNKGFVLLQQGFVQKATEHILQSLDLHKSNSYAYRNLALVYLKENKREEAYKALLQARRYRFTSHYGSEVDELLATFEISNTPQ